MTGKKHERLSKFLSYVLRHNPGVIGLEMDSQGWVSVEELIRGAAREGQPLTREILMEIVATNDKRRFSLTDDGLHIRASQGHSIKIDLGLEQMVPPSVLYHGTATRFLKSIMKHGLRSAGRHHVHLSLDHRAIREAAGKGHRHLAVKCLCARAGEFTVAPGRTRPVRMG